MRRPNWMILIVTALLLIPACGGQMPESHASASDTPGDARDPGFTGGGKADSEVPEEGCSVTPDAPAAPAAPPRLEVDSDQTTTAMPGAPHLAQIPAGVVVEGFGPGAYPQWESDWHLFDPETLQTLDKGGEVMRVPGTHGVIAPVIAAGQDHIYFGFTRDGGYHNGHQCMLTRLDARSTQTVTHAGHLDFCNGQYYASADDYASVLYVNTEDNAVRFATLTGTADEQTGSRVVVAEPDASSTSYVYARALAYSPGVERYVAVYLGVNYPKASLYSVLVKPTRNFGSVATQPVAILNTNLDEGQQYTAALSEVSLTWNGEGFGLFGLDHNTLVFRSLDAAGEPEADAVDVVDDVRSFAAVRSGDRYVIVTNSTSDARPTAHLVSATGEELASLQLSAEPAAHPALVAAEAGFVAGWADPNNKINLMRFRLAE